MRGETSGQGHAVERDRIAAPREQRGTQRSTQDLGREGEDFACAVLRRGGLRVLQRNYRVRGGEVDIVAQDGDVLVFVEVRRRACAAWGGAAASVGARKRARLVCAARHFLARAGVAAAQSACRFDVVAIDGTRLRWIRAAFDAGSRN